MVEKFEKACDNFISESHLKRKAYEKYATELVNNMIKELYCSESTDYKFEHNIHFEEKHKYNDIIYIMTVVREKLGDLCYKYNAENKPTYNVDYCDGDIRVILKFVD